MYKNALSLSLSIARSHWQQQVLLSPGSSRRSAARPDAARYRVAATCSEYWRDGGPASSPPPPPPVTAAAAPRLHQSPPPPPPPPYRRLYRVSSAQRWPWQNAVPYYRTSACLILFPGTIIIIIIMLVGIFSPLDYRPRSPMYRDVFEMSIDRVLFTPSNTVRWWWWWWRCETRCDILTFERRARIANSPPPRRVNKSRFAGTERLSIVPRSDRRRFYA